MFSLSRFAIYYFAVFYLVHLLSSPKSVRSGFPALPSTV